ncbi:MAG: 6-hydroxymethylpterin diphosphokinase MptE-like protein [Verrucomicrobiota bacterium]
MSHLALKPFRSAGLPLGENDARIKALKDIHSGRRAFIIGNGPSLTVADLERLKGEVTFASNKIYLAFHQTDWRPTYYSVCDKLVAKNNSKIISELPLNKLLSDWVGEYFQPADASIWLRELAVAGSRSAEGQPHPFSENLLVGVYGGATIIYQQLQMAYYMGITEVILIGLDFSFQLPEQRVTTGVHGYEEALKSAGEVNHFHPDYRKPGEAWAVPNMEGQRYSFQSARDRFQAAGRKVINASRVTKLDVFPRGNFDAIVGR